MYKTTEYLNIYRIFVQNTFSMDVQTHILSCGGFIRTRDIKTNRSMYQQLRMEVDKGSVVRIRNGIYALPDQMAKTMIDVETIVPNGIVCMYSAWAYYSLTTKVPPNICVAISQKRKVVLPDYPPIMLYYWLPDTLEMGAISQVIDGYSVRIYDLERSVCDAIKFRNRIGIDISSEILKNYLRRSDKNLTKLNRYASKLRIAKTLNNLIDYML